MTVLNVNEYKAILAEIIRTDGVNLDAALESMQPNNPVIALGMVVFLTDLGLTPEQIIERFRVQSHAK